MHQQGECLQTYWLQLALALQRDWTLVGGGVEEGENDWQAILREIAEETGIVAVKAIEMSGMPHWFVFSDEIKAQRQLDHDGQIAKVFFIVIASDTIIRLQAEEVRAYCWVTFNEAINCIKKTEQRELFIQVANEFI